MIKSWVIIKNFISYSLFSRKQTQCILPFQNQRYTVHLYGLSSFHQSKSIWTIQSLVQEYTKLSLCQRPHISFLDYSWFIESSVFSKSHLQKSHFRYLSIQRDFVEYLSLYKRRNNARLVNDIFNQYLLLNWFFELNSLILINNIPICNHSLISTITYIKFSSFSSPFFLITYMQYVTTLCYKKVNITKVLLTIKAVNRKLHILNNMYSSRHQIHVVDCK